MHQLTATAATIDSGWYYDPDHYARELDAIWYREWVCVGRREQLSGPGSFFLAKIGTQQVIITLDANCTLRAFHNTCRHRGSVLCTSDSGRFRNGRIVCPYHAWTYALDGTLAATPNRIETDDFRHDDFSLYDVRIGTWGGFIFVNLGEDESRTLAVFLGDEADAVAEWPLEALRVVHEERSIIACNWKIFWENYSECYHCPRLHPELCKIVPVYRQGVLGLADLPGWQPENAEDDGRPRVREGSTTWTLDGESALPRIEGPTAASLQAGMCFASFTASMFIVAHPDYVRTVCMLPRGPECVELVVSWLLMPGVAEQHPDQLDKLLALGRLVVAQDATACALNQQGVKSKAHRHGVLVPQEWAVHEFHEWLRQRLAELPT